MKLAEAKKEALREVSYPMSTAQSERWNEARKVLIEHGYCPACACDGDNGKLGKWQPGDSENYAGRECYLCEEFVRCGEQPEYDTSPDCHSDADSGL